MRTIKINLDNAVFNELEKIKDNLHLAWDKLIIAAILKFKTKK